VWSVYGIVLTGECVFFYGMVLTGESVDCLGNGTDR